MPETSHATRLVGRS